MEGRGKAYYPSSSALNYLNANDVRGRRGRETVVEDDGEEDTEGKWERERERVWQERTRRSRGGLICCCSRSLGAVWLF